jgi:hypothetical protein
VCALTEELLRFSADCYLDSEKNEMFSVVLPICNLSLSGEQTLLVSEVTCLRGS